MGADTFFDHVKGESFEEAFKAAVEEAAYDYGHAGYTGTIAEKDSFVVIEELNGKSLSEVTLLSDKLVDEGDPRVDDKWGPAGAAQLDDGTFVFFGWASS